MNKKILSIIFGLALVVTGVRAVQAAVSDYQQPKVSITFDDGFESTYTNALPVLASRGLTGVVYVTTDFIGQPGYMTWAQVTSLQNDYGWEIGSHTVSHPELPETNLTTIISELKDSLQILLGQGLSVTNFASPFGAYNNDVLFVAAKLYQSHRGFWDRDDLNSWPYNNSVLTVISVESSTTPEQVFGYINQAKSEKKWLVLVLHDVQDKLDPEYEYITLTSDLAQIADYLIQAGVTVTTVNEAQATPQNNLFTNYSFEAGFEPWLTDNPAQVNVDGNENGVYPNPTNSVSFTGNQKAHLFSPHIPVAYQKDYLVKFFVDTKDFTQGELGYYIDEYNSSGDWISGQWLAAANNKNVAYFSRFYQPTSTNVTQIRFQVYLTQGSSGIIYLDNFEFYDLSADVTITPTPEPTPTPTPEPTPTPTPEPTPEPTPTPTPTPEPTPEPTPTPTPTPMPTPTPAPVKNLVANPSFEQVDEQNWATNWTRQTTEFAINSQAAGNEGSNSVELNGTNRTHLFSSFISIDPTLSYIWQQYVRVISLGTEFGFYIDEYDTAGNWISGQWKGMVRTNQDGIISTNYTPTSSRVTQIGLQYYSIGGNSNQLILDSVTFSPNE